MKLECMKGEKRFKEALECYETSNAKSISRYGAEDPVTYNNRGNAHAGLGEWDKAVEFYHKAAEMNKNYVFARANEALALYQLGSYEKVSLCIAGYSVRKPFQI
uniref:Tetratricopeptide repeat protein n=1 Tax=Rhodosorus marinus TaxID=101924 RepID=A0A7S3A2V5_9RHOD|mmetsp:Transcript_42842/g.167418  ORF Transcript_42842/g.167418 Transcript_42842/m.167418 type:complete len:104 (+) Transcript_42842:881-1192(+)